MASNKKQKRGGTAVAYLIGRRLALVEAEVRAAAPSSAWVRLPTPPPPTPPRNFKEEVAKLGHRLRRTGRFLRCVACQTWRRSLAGFLRQPCTRKKAVTDEIEIKQHCEEPSDQQDRAGNRIGMQQKEEDEHMDRPWQLLTHAQRKRKLEQLSLNLRAEVMQEIWGIHKPKPQAL